MPEGDTVFHTAAILRQALVGLTLTRCDVRVPRYATVDLAGHPVEAVLSRGKHLFIRVGPASIHSHLKMDGSWRISRRGKPTHSSRHRSAAHKIRILLEAGDVSAAGIDLGILEILDRRSDLDVVEHLGPDLLGDNWDPALAAANLSANPDRPIAEALLDQRVMAGVGNVYSNELCFLFGRLPTSPVSSLRDPLRVVTRARDMLWANRLRWSRTTTGDTRPSRALWVYGRVGEPCRRCGTPISRGDGPVGERISYWCQACQR
ncbi:MAG: Fpg/Nei family DNA glycosylase [Mycobacterium sp.]|nr:Fpg/Nei family DNA glycosylase [Mycobacterium sp.]